MKHPNEEEIRKEILRSQKSLRSAKKLLEEGLLEDAISRSYYAVLHAAKAVLLSENVTVSSHEAAKRLFSMHLVKTGKIERKYSEILSEEKDERYLADYDVAFIPEQESVEKMITDAEDFQSEMVKYLENQGIKIDKGGK